MKGAEKIFAFVKYYKDGNAGKLFSTGYLSGIWKAAAFLLMLILPHFSVSAQTGNTWYNYSVDNSDNWDNWKRWTLDPDGTLLVNPDSLTPKAIDTVVILNGSTVNITRSNKAAAVLEIRSGGIVNISDTTSGHNFAIIRGDGRIKLSADNYPAGDDTEFRNHGTVEYNGGTTTYLLNSLNSSKTFHNLIINLDNSSDSVTIITPDTLTINNDLEIRRGNLKINDATNNRKLIINVLRNVTVQSEGKITTGKGNPWASAGYNYGILGFGQVLPSAGNFHKIYHELNIGGDFVNFGKISFTNLSSPKFNNFATNGAVTVRFQGSGNNSVNLYGPATFYNLVIDKGNSQTYVTTVYSANSNYFRLFGGNMLERLETGGSNTSANPEVRKALWIKNGTLRLTGNIYIPSLTEGYLSLLDFGLGDYTIGANACLWIDGDNVTVNGTADANFGTPASVGVSTPLDLTYQGLSIFGKFRITKGTYNGNGSSGMMLFSNDEASIQVEGGNVNICQLRSYSLAPGKATYNQSGGAFTVRGKNGGNGWLLDASPLFELSDPNSNFLMSGGSLNLTDVTAADSGDFYINSAEGNYSVTGGDINIRVKGGQNFDINTKANLWNLNIANANPASGTFTTRLLQSIKISNNLSIRDTAIFDPYKDTYDVTIGGNLTIGSSTGSTTARFYPRNNTTTFDGSGNSLITVSGSSLNNCFNPNHFNINKANAASKVSLAYRPGVADTVARVRGNFTINNGTFDYGAYYLTVAGNLDNNGIMGIWNTKGKIVLRNTAAMQTITAGINPSVVFGHLDVAHTDGSANHVQLNSNVSCDLFTLTSGRVFLQNYRLSIDTNFVSGSFGYNRMIYTAAENGARGLRFKMDGNYSVPSTTITFPVSSGTSAYYKNEIIISNIGIVSGYLTVIPVALVHPTTDPLGSGCNGDYINYYWRTVKEGLTGPSSGVEYRFYYGTAPKNSKGCYFINNSWEENGGKNTTPTLYAYYNDLLGALNGFKSGEFTLSKKNCFRAVEVKRSITSGDWDNGAIWDPSGAPDKADVVIINSGHKVNISADNQGASTVYIRNGGTLDVGTYSNLTFERVSGGGKFRIASDAGTPVLPNGDFDEFLLNDSAIFEYYGAGSYTLPSTASGGAALNYYPNLKIGGTSGSVKTLPATTITIRKDLMVYDDTNSGAVLKLNPGAVSGDLIIQDSLKFRNGGTLMFPAAGAKRTVSVEKSIDFADGGNADANSIYVENAAATYANNFHSLIVKEDIRMNDNSSLVLFRDSANRRAVNLCFRGNINSTITKSASTGIHLNFLNIEKDNPADSVSILSDVGFTYDHDKPVTLTQGALILDNAGINVSLTFGTLGSFTIPETGQLTVAHGTIRVSGNNGIILNNRLRLQHNSQLLMSNFNQDNFIEYTSTGKSELLIEDTATLKVGGQIRRKTTTESGSLIYTQTGAGSVVTVGDQSSGNSSRGMFEILNPGSSFTYTGGNLIIGRAQNSVDPALYLDPASYSLAGGSRIIFGNANTPVNDVIGLYSSIPLKDIEVSNNNKANTVRVHTLPIIADSILVQPGQTFNANGNDITLNGNLHLFSATSLYNAGTNTTSFTGSGQKIIGEATFHHLTINTSDSVRMYNNITVAGDLLISAGQLSDRKNLLTLKGNLINNGHHFSESLNTGGLIFQGTVRQKVGGTGIFGLMEIDNSKGVELQNDFTLVDRNINLKNGSLYLREYQLDLGLEANITATGGFSVDRMLVTNGAVSDKGIRRAIPAGTPPDIMIPVGVIGKYTPVNFSGFSNSGSGFLSVRPVNQAHPTATDPQNVLQYYWNVKTEGFTAFNASMNLNYLPSDVALVSPNLEEDYIPAYLKDVSWAKFDKSNVDETNHIISFIFNTGANINGDFTAGIPDAIPDQVPVFFTVKDGTWTDISVWKREDGTTVTEFPRGYVVKIRNHVTITEDLKSAYKTIIEQGGQLDVGTTIRHYLGLVSGTGHLSIETGRLPAGNYESFFACDGGTMEYGGSASYEIPDESPIYRRLIFSGSGTKLLPARNLTICDTLWIKDAVKVDNSTHNNQLTINGLLQLDAGAEFEAGTGSNATVVFNGTYAQKITGNFTGVNHLNNFTMNNSAGLVLDGDVSMEGLLTLTNGRIQTSSTNSFTMEIASSVIPLKGSSNSFIDGPLKKWLASGSTFIFPVGKGTRNGFFTLSGTATTKEEIWTAQYYTSVFANTTCSSPLTNISKTEYWQVAGPAGGQSKVTGRWDPESDINPLSVGGISNMRLAEYNSTLTNWQSIGDIVSGNDENGTVTSNALLTPGNSKYYTLGTIAAIIKAKIRFSGLSQVCSGASNNIAVSFLNGSPDYTFGYSVNGGPVVNVTASANPYSFTGSTAGRYQIVSFTANGIAGVVDTASIWVNPVPVVNLVSSDPDNVICDGTAVTFTATSGYSSYNFLLDGSGIQNSASHIYNTTSLINNNIVSVVATNSYGCATTSAGITTLVNPLPVASLSGAGNICEGQSASLNLSLTGTSSWNVTYTDGTTPQTLNGITSPYSITVNPASTTSYSVTSVSDGNGCIGTSFGSPVLITVLPLPNTGDLYRKPNN